ncbi:MAG: glycosyltransferase [Planctomycetota bacterium]|nr:glycosyltransferase [Planctomycetota bacterium]
MSVASTHSTGPIARNESRDEVPAPIVLVTTADASGSTGLQGRLAERGMSARIVYGPDRASSRAHPFTERWRQILAGRKIACTSGLPYPSLIHAVGTRCADLAVELASRWKCPYLLTIEEFLCPGARLRLARRWCRGVIVPGADLADDLIGNLGVPSRLVTIVRPGVPAATTPPATPSPSCRPVVGTAVGSGFGSGLPTFLDAARMVLASGTEVEFVLAELGSGTALARRLAEGLAIAERITITEGIDLGRSFWPLLDVYAHTSRQPSSGRPLLNAMAHGIPSIASQVPGLREIAAGGECACIVPPGDAEALAATILGLLSDRVDAEGVGSKGRDRILADYAPEREADALVGLYRAAIESSTGAGGRHRSDAAASAVASRRS